MAKKHNLDKLAAVGRALVWRLVLKLDVCMAKLCSDTMMKEVVLVL